MEEQHHPTAPFGRRTQTFAHAASQPSTKVRSPENAVHKWNRLRSICTARRRIGVSELTSDSQLSLDTDCMASARLRRQLAVLGDASLIVRRNSPRDKRRLRKGRGGELDGVLGFNLLPFFARTGEFIAFAEDIRPHERVPKLVGGHIAPRVFARDAKAGGTPDVLSQTFQKSNPSPLYAFAPRASTPIARPSPIRVGGGVNTDRRPLGSATAKECRRQISGEAGAQRQIFEPARSSQTVLRSIKALRRGVNRVPDQSIRRH